MDMRAIPKQTVIMGFEVRIKKAHGHDIIPVSL
jgi:hypothetical protein